jgi:hypothetical protein
MDYTPGHQIANYERPALVPQPKARPHLLVKREAAGKVKTKDQAERDKCHVRSGRRCEVLEIIGGRVFRCGKPVSENHHLIGGSGRRNKGKSILAAHRLDTCDRCHSDITGKVLRPIDGTKKECAATVRYSRVK